MSWLFAYSAPRTAASILGIALTMFGIFLTFLELAGVPGSPATLAIVSVIVALSISTLLIVAWVARWAILYPAIKTYVKDRLRHTVTSDTILVTLGVGGTIVMGMVAKALQELDPPVSVSRTLAIDLAYPKNGSPEVGKLLPPKFNLAGQPVLIVISYLGTGSGLRAIRERLRIQDSPVFSLVVSDAAASRMITDRDHYLVIGSRAVIPWEQSVSKNTVTQ
jgi:hypothetical protein